MPQNLSDVQKENIRILVKAAHDLWLETPELDYQRMTRYIREYTAAQGYEAVVGFNGLLQWFGGSLTHNNPQPPSKEEKS